MRLRWWRTKPAPAAIRVYLNGRELKPWELRAGMKVRATRYDHAQGSTAAEVER